MLAVCSDFIVHSHFCFRLQRTIFAMLRALSNHLDGFCAGGSAPASVLSLMLSTMGKDFKVQICRVTGDMLIENIARSCVLNWNHAFPCIVSVWGGILCLCSFVD